MVEPNTKRSRTGREQERADSQQSTSVVAPALDPDDNLGELLDIDINSIVKEIWEKRQNVQTSSSSEEFRSATYTEMPMAHSSLHDALTKSHAVVARMSRQVQRPGYFGFIAPQGVPTDPLSFAMTAALNQNCVSAQSSPGNVVLEQAVISWLNQLVGFESSAGGCLLSGGSLSNFTALASALVRKFGADYRSKGLLSCVEAGQRPTIICSAEAHFCVQRAAAMLGIGVDNVIVIEVDDRACMRMDLLEQAVHENPCVVCIVASAGTTQLGGIDPIRDIAHLCERRNIWLHVDAAYGGAVLMSPKLKALLDGIELADSVTLDLHKWFYMSLDASAILYKDARHTQELFRMTGGVGKDLGIEPASAFFLLGPELSRRMRALPLYIAFQTYGFHRLGRNVLHNVQCAAYLANMVDVAEDFSLVLQPKLSIVIFRMSPPGVNAEKVDALNLHIVAKLAGIGKYYMSPSTVQSRPTLRVCVVNYSTSAHHMLDLLGDIRKIGNCWIESQALERK